MYTIDDIKSFWNNPFENIIHMVLNAGCFKILFNCISDPYINNDSDLNYNIDDGIMYNAYSTNYTNSIVLSKQSLSFNLVNETCNFNNSQINHLLDPKLIIIADSAQSRNKRQEYYEQEDLFGRNRVFTQVNHAIKTQLIIMDSDIGVRVYLKTIRFKIGLTRGKNKSFVAPLRVYKKVEYTTLISCFKTNKRIFIRNKPISPKTIMNKFIPLEWLQFLFSVSTNSDIVLNNDNFYSVNWALTLNDFRKYNSYRQFLEAMFNVNLDKVIVKLPYELISSLLLIKNNNKSNYDKIVPYIINSKLEFNYTHDAYDNLFNSDIMSRSTFINKVCYLIAIYYNSKIGIEFRFAYDTIRLILNSEQDSYDEALSRINLNINSNQRMRQLHDSLVKEQNRKIEENRLKELSELFENNETINKLEQYSMERISFKLIKTALELFNEGKKLEHCVYGYKYGIIEKNYVIYSVKTIEGNFTLQLGKNFELMQIKGLRNIEPSNGLLLEIIWLIDTYHGDYIKNMLNIAA